MSFLSCSPAVFAVGDRYEILLNTNECGMCSVRVGDAVCDDRKAGILVTEELYHKISVPMAVLDAAGAYTVRYRRTIERKSYFSTFAEEECAEFSFRPLPAEGDIRIYHTADVHCSFDLGCGCASYFGGRPDLLIVNGDIAEVNRDSDFLDVARFVGDITGGEIPVLFARGNHDTRGRLAAHFSDYFPTENGAHYFPFSLGRLCGVVLDCGEDKYDDHPEYGGMNRFEDYRRAELEFLRGTALPAGKIPFAISHICPVRTAQSEDSMFNIEKEVYTEWNRELERMGIRFMITGHTHRAAFVEPDEGTLPHKYPVIVGSDVRREEKKLAGCAMIVREKSIWFGITDADGNVIMKKEMEL